MKEHSFKSVSAVWFLVNEALPGVLYLKYMTMYKGTFSSPLCQFMRKLNTLKCDLIQKRKISTTISVSCHISRNTVEVVDDCPDSKEKWGEAAARKNCTVYASQCDKPQQLVYHCVINSYTNETLELCAYGKYILSGYCTEYSLLGNRIQQNLRTNCTQFKENPCPSGYHSTEAYKYPGCYKLTKEMTTQAKSNLKKGGIITVANLPAHDYDKAETRNISKMINMERPEDKESTKTNVNMTYWLVPLVIFIVGVAFGLAYFISTKKKKPHKDNPEDNAATMPLDPIT